MVVATAVSSRGADSTPPIFPTGVQAILKKNATLFSNVLITGERSRRLLGPAQAVLNALRSAEDEVDFTQKLHFELRFKGPQFRESTQYPPGNAYKNDVIFEMSFDGTKFCMAEKDLKDIASSSILVYDPIIAAAHCKTRDEPQMLDKMDFSYLVETGFVGPNTIDKLGQPVESAILNAADHDQVVAVSSVDGGNGKMLEVIIEQPEPWQSRETFDVEKHEAMLSLTNGTNQLRMQWERERRQLVGKHRVIRFWLNSELGYAVEEKWESRKETGEAMFHTNNSDFVQVGPDGLWTPKRCVVESHAYAWAPLFVSPHPLYETVILMDKCEPSSFHDYQFRSLYDTPGVSIFDYTSPKATLQEADTYRV